MSELGGSLQQFRLLARYNQWMNQQLYAVCDTMADIDRKRDLGAFFKSIHGTLNHLLYGDKAWLGRFTGRPFDVTLLGHELYADFAELRLAREHTDAEILAWCDTLTDAWLASDFEFTSRAYGQTRVLPAWALVTHLFNHQTHHRGQVTTLIKQLGYEPGIIDLPWMPEFDTPATG